MSAARLDVTVSAIPGLARLSSGARKVIGAAVVTMVVAGVLLVAMRPAWLSLSGAVLAVLGIWIGLAPGLAYCLNPRRPPIPLLPLTCLFYVVFFALPVFLLDPSWWTTAGSRPGRLYGIEFQQLDVVAIGLVPAGLLLMLGAHALCGYVVRGRIPRFALPENRNPRRVRALLWLLLLGHLAYEMVPSVARAASVGQLLGPAGCLAYGMFFVLWTRGLLPRGQSVAVFLVLLPVEMVHIFATGLLTKLIYFGIFMAVMIIYARRWWLMLVLVVFIGLLVPAFYPAVQEFRARTWNQASVDYSKRAKAALFIDLMVEKWHKGYKRADFAGLEIPLIRRVSLIVLFSHVVKKTPEPVPYMHGATYRPLPTSFVPRLIWPGKPEERLGQTFGHRYSILLTDDKITSINVPWIVEMYANFGIPGVLVGMTLVGALLYFLGAVFNFPESRALEFVIGTTIVLPLFYQESNFSLMTGSLLPLSVALWLYFRMGLTVFRRNVVD